MSDDLAPSSGRRRRTIAAGLVGVVATVGLAAVAASLQAGGERVPAALERVPNASDAISEPSAVRLRSLGFDVETSRQIAPDLYLIEREGGRLCTAYASKHAVSGGCRAKASFFAGEPLLFGIGERGGPNSPSFLVIDGVARPEVLRVRAHFGSVTLDTQPTPEGGFVLTATPEALAHGRPTLLEALDANGRVLKAYKLPNG
jgi:hypothetical protein